MNSPTLQSHFGQKISTNTGTLVVGSERPSAVRREKIFHRGRSLQAAGTSVRLRTDRYAPCAKRSDSLAGLHDLDLAHDSFDPQDDLVSLAHDEFVGLELEVIPLLAIHDTSAKTSHPLLFATGPADAQGVLQAQALCRRVGFQGTACDAKVSGRRRGTQGGGVGACTWRSRARE